jgi:hypothetical protein
MMRNGQVPERSEGRAACQTVAVVAGAGAVGGGVAAVRVGALDRGPTVPRRFAREGLQG